MIVLGSQPHTFFMGLEGLSGIVYTVQGKSKGLILQGFGSGYQGGCAVIRDFVRECQDSIQGRFG